MLKKYLFLASAILIVSVSAARASSINTSAKQAIVFDVETGTVLLNKNADERMPTSSMSKVLTAFVIFDALKDGTIKPDDTFKVSEKAWRKGGSKMFVEVNKDINIMDLLRGVIIQSGNDATIVLAEGLSGSEEAFASKMNDKAKDLGMNDSNFMNASGWPNPEHYSTARDLGKLASALIEDHQEYYKLYSEKEFSYNDIPQQNRNPLLYQNIGADGIKTGHTDAGGYGLIGSGVKNDRRVIFVVNGLESSAARAQESKKLLQWALNSFKNEIIINADDIVGEANIVLGKAEKVSVSVKRDIKLTVPHNAAKKIKLTTHYNGPIKAPITKGQEIGTLTISVPNQDNVKHIIYAAESVEAKGFVAQLIFKAKTLLLGA
ncbi:MAG: D-alanyl-D-alanine carboxypeptidase family protein [Bdellovibrionales bacterium]